MSINKMIVKLEETLEDLATVDCTIEALKRLGGKDAKELLPFFAEYVVNYCGPYSLEQAAKRLSHQTLADLSRVVKKEVKTRQETTDYPY